MFSFPNPLPLLQQLLHPPRVSSFAQIALECADKRVESKCCERLAASQLNVLPNAKSWRPITNPRQLRNQAPFRPLEKKHRENWQGLGYGAM